MLTPLCFCVLPGVWVTGVYRHFVGSYLGDHAVKLLGWGVENGVDYWLAANSWNEHWGDKGGLVDRFVV